MPLLEERKTYKPLEYEWAMEYWKKQQQVHWLADEVPLGDDVKDFSNKLTEAERNVIMHIFRFFTQSDIEILQCYHERYKSVFKPVEIQMMLTAFGNMETVHIVAYSHLLDTLGIPESEYSAFLEYKQMKDKFDFLHEFNPNGSKEDIALNMAMFSGATEGVFLFSAFAILLNFARHNKMKGMGDIVSWSVRDESMHCEGIAKLFKTFLNENYIDYEILDPAIYNGFKQAVEIEHRLIDLIFEMGPLEDLTADDMKQYIMYMADYRLGQLGYDPIYKIKDMPLPWLPAMLNAPEFGNFFETRVTDYSKSATEGNWDDAWNI